MTDDDVRRRLDSLLADVPGGPLEPPADLTVRAERRSRRRRALVSGVAALAVVGVLGASLLILNGGARDEPERLANGGSATGAPPVLAWDGSYDLAEREAFERVFTGPPAAASEVTRLTSIEDGLLRADLVVVGHLRDVATSRVLGITYTGVRLEIDEVLSGDPTIPSVVFEFGGTIDDPSTLPRGTAIWFLHEKQDGVPGRYRLVSSQGIVVPGPQHADVPGYPVGPPGTGTPVNDAWADEISQYPTLESLADVLRR